MPTPNPKPPEIASIEQAREIEAVPLSTTTIIAPWPAGVRIDERAIQDFGNARGGGYHGARTDISSPLGRKGIYSIFVRTDYFLVPASFDGWSQEYSAGLSRDLYHVTIKGRLGTAPPDAKYPATVNGVSLKDQTRPAYHLAAGEAVFTMYGLDLGPEHPELSSAIWESTGPVPNPATLDRTWVSQFRLIYTNTDFHIQQSQRLFVLVQNNWQIDARETWRDRTSLALQTGFNDYSKPVSHNAPSIFLNNIDYYGSPGAILGWPNNYGSVQIRQRLTPGLSADSGFTRLSLYNDAQVLMCDAHVEWRPNSHWKLAPGFAYNFRRRSGARRGILLNISYTW